LIVIYDENMNVMESPDFSKGYTYTRYFYDGTTATIYHAYTQEELEAIEEAKSGPTQEERIATLEEALDMILLGVTE